MIALYLGLLGLLAFISWERLFGDMAETGTHRKLMLKNPAGWCTFSSSPDWAHRLWSASFTPGLTHLDELVGFAPLPLKTLFLILGLILAIPGLYLSWDLS